MGWCFLVGKHHGMHGKNVRLGEMMVLRCIDVRAIDLVVLVFVVVFLSYVELCANLTYENYTICT
jgi:hypothetical protein